LEKPSLKEKENFHAQTKRFYFNRAYGCYCHHGATDGYTASNTSAGKETSKGSRLSVEPTSIGINIRSGFR